MKYIGSFAMFIPIVFIVLVSILHHDFMTIAIWEIGNVVTIVFRVNLIMLLRVCPK